MDDTNQSENENKKKRKPSDDGEYDSSLVSFCDGPSDDDY